MPIRIRIQIGISILMPMPILIPDLDPEWHQNETSPDADPFFFVKHQGAKHQQRSRASTIFTRAKRRDMIKLDEICQSKIDFGRGIRILPQVSHMFEIMVFILLFTAMPVYNVFPISSVTQAVLWIRIGSGSRTRRAKMAQQNRKQ